MTEMHAASSHAVCTLTGEDYNRWSNDAVRRFERIPTVSSMYWPVNGLATMHVVLTEKKICFPRNKTRFTRCDHATIRPLSSEMTKAFPWRAVPWLRRLVAGLSPRRPGFDPRSSPCEIYGGESGTGTGFSPSCRFSPVDFIPLVLH
jgi:hypothetical protein